MVGARHAEAGGVPGRPPRGGAGQRGGLQARHAAATLRAARAEDGDGHDWSAVSWHEGLGREDLTSLGFLERREDLVPMGNAGTGKTHMASVPCMMACERRMEARFFTASSLVMRLRRARDERRPDRKAALIGRARLLVINELGFPPLDPDGARPLFQVFADPYERQSVAITTNLEISRWGAVFGDDQMAAAVIDRIVHHGRLVQFRGESYRVRNALTQEGQVRKNAAHPGRANCSKIDDHSTQKLLTKHMWGEHGKTMVKMHPAETFIVRTVRSFSRSRKARRCLVPSRFLHAFREPHMSAIRYGYSSSSVTPR